MKYTSYEGCRTPVEVAAARGERIGRVIDRDAPGYEKSPYPQNRAERRRWASNRRTAKASTR